VLCVPWSGCSFACSEMWHEPVQCKWLKEWIKKCDDDSETSNWLVANTKVNFYVIIVNILITVWFVGTACLLPYIVRV